LPIKLKSYDNGIKVLESSKFTFVIIFIIASYN